MQVVLLVPSDRIVHPRLTSHGGPQFRFSHLFSHLTIHVGFFSVSPVQEGGQSIQTGLPQFFFLVWEGDREKASGTPYISLTPPPTPVACRRPSCSARGPTPGSSCSVLASGPKHVGQSRIIREGSGVLLVCQCNASLVFSKLTCKHINRRKKNASSS